LPIFGLPASIVDAKAAPETPGWPWPSRGRRGVHEELRIGRRRIRLTLFMLPLRSGRRQLRVLHVPEGPRQPAPPVGKLVEFSQESVSKRISLLHLAKDAIEAQFERTCNRAFG